MIHTFLAKFQLTRNEYLDYQENLMKYVELMKTKGTCKHFPPKEQPPNAHIYTYCIKSGLTIKTIRLFNQYCYYGIQLEINPATLLKEYNLFKLTTQDDIPALMEKVSKILNKIGLNINFNDMNVRRVDFAQNIYFDTEQQADIYLDLMKKYLLPHTLKIKTYYSETGKRQVAYKNSIYLFNASVRVNIYNKLDQLETLPDYCFPYMDDTPNVIRFEIQTLYRRLAYLKKQNKFNTYNPIDILNDDLSMETLMYYCNELFLYGDYYSFDEAVKIINNRNIKSKTKNLMIDFMEDIKKSSIRNVKKDFIDNRISISKFDNMIRNFDKLGVNPVTIPKKHGYKRIPNPMIYLTFNTDKQLWIEDK